MQISLSLTVANIWFSIALIIVRDALSCRARLLITHPRMFISSSSQAFLLPPSGRRALSSSDRRWNSVLVFHPSLTLLGWTEKRLAAASPEFSSAYFTTESLNFKPYLVFFFFFAAPEPWRSSMWYWQAQYMKKGEEEKREVSVVTSSSLIYIIDLAWTRWLIDIDIWYYYYLVIYGTLS